ncbi:MAG TPA: fluoride efflux transporter CrcB [Gemmatimonadaceae bacterium]|nr:fluoride efflux transporter CrcB [Gemmatimonadaceae bacterium]
MNRLIGYVAVGSALGGVCRLLMTAFVQQRIGSAFPLGTMLVNITGSFLLGFIVRYSLGAPAVTPEIRALLTTGFCGGFTTFSAYSFETASLLEEGQYGRAGLYVVASVLLSVLATFAGFAVAPSHAAK